MRVETPHVLGEVGGRRVALALDEVESVLPMLALEPVPGGPAALLGVANLGGEPVPVLTLRGLFGLAHDPDDLDHRIVVCRLGERRLGLCVDAVHDLGVPSNLRAPTAADRLVAMEVVRAFGVCEGNVCAVLDPRIAAEWLARTLERLEPQQPGPEESGEAADPHA